MKKICIIFFIILGFQNTGKSQAIQLVNSFFDELSTDTLTVIPNSPFFRLDLFHQSKPIPKNIDQVFKSYTQLHTCGSTETCFGYGIGRFKIDDIHTGYLINVLSKDFPHQVGIYLYTYDKMQYEFSNPFLVSGFVSESAESQTQSWVLDYNQDGSLDILLREYSLAHFADTSILGDDFYLLEFAEGQFTKPNEKNKMPDSENLKKIFKFKGAFVNEE